MNQHKGTKSGFTLIELLVVIAIIAILAAILFPVFAQARKKAYQAAGTSNARQASMAIMQYIQDYDEAFPRCGYGDQSGAGWYNTHEVGEWQDATAPYHKNAGIFTSPGDASTSGSSGVQTPVNGNFSLLYNDIISHDCDVTNGFSNCVGAQHTEQIARPLAAIVAPADCVLLAEGHGGWDKSAGAPSPLPPDWTGSRDPHSKWHLEESISGFQTMLLAGSSYGGWGQTTVGTPFYNGTGVVAFCDGHVKAIKMTDGNGHPVLCSTLPWTKNMDPFQRNADDTADYCNPSGPNPPGGGLGQWQ